MVSVPRKGHTKRTDETLKPESEYQFFSLFKKIQKPEFFRIFVQLLKLRIDLFRRFFRNHGTVQVFDEAQNKDIPIQKVI